MQDDCGRAALFLSTLPQTPTDEKITEGPLAFRLSPFAREVRFAGPSFSERCLLYVDCRFAINGYSNDKWFTQLQNECGHRSAFLSDLKLAKNAGLLTCEAWEVLMPQLESSIPAVR